MDHDDGAEVDPNTAYCYWYKQACNNQPMEIKDEIYVGEGTTNAQHCHSCGNSCI
jgi:hypothetical protein